MTMKSLLLIFVKNPVAGKVKTRLAASVGDRKALQVYRDLLLYTRNLAREVAADKQVWYADRIEQNDLWGEGKEFGKRVQQGTDLGQRMCNAFEIGFKEGFEKVVIIGSDCAELKPRHLQSAFEALAKNEVVIGPSEDGGYYLLGMSRFIPDLFSGIEWSSSSVYDETCRKITERSLDYAELEVLNDIDTAADLGKSTVGRQNAE